MDALFLENGCLDSLDTTENKAENLTRIVNKILTDDPQSYDRKTILELCHLLLFSDESSTKERMFLAYVARMKQETAEVVVNVVEVKENLEPLMEYHKQIYQRVNQFDDHTNILPSLLLCLITDPRKVTPDVIQTRMESSRTCFTYKRKRSKEEEEKKEKEEKEEKEKKSMCLTTTRIPSPSHQPVYDDCALSAALGLYTMSASPERPKVITSPKEIRTDGSTISQVSSASSISPRKCHLILDEFYG